MITGKRKPKEALTREQTKKKSVSKIEATTTSTEKPLGNTGAVAGSRADLMAQAASRGIKYFRILTKQELHEVLSGHQRPEVVEAIIESAKKRWKAGWTKKTNK